MVGIPGVLNTAHGIGHEPIVPIVTLLVSHSLDETHLPTQKNNKLHFYCTEK